MAGNSTRATDGGKWMKRVSDKLLPWAVMALGIAGMVLGASRGELKILFTKAINLCLEYVGIG